MRRVSKKRAKRNNEVRDFRAQYKADHPNCEVYCCSAKATELHEISRGPARSKALDVEAALLHLCHECHWKMNAFSVVKQLALKKLAGSGYDRQRVNKLRDRQPDAITEAEVDEAVRELEAAPKANIGHVSQNGTPQAVMVPRARE
jgi:hypothetical protein